MKDYITAKERLPVEKNKTVQEISWVAIFFVCILCVLFQLTNGVIYANT